jgi:hypothetical protein
MTVYKISNSTNTYDVIDLNTVSLAEILSQNTEHDKSTLIKMLRGIASKNISLKEMWPEEIACNYFGNSRKQDYDITRFGKYIVLKMNVVEVLHEELSKSGELLPLNVEGNKMMLFNCLTFGQEQEDLCIKRYEDGYQYGLETLYFNEDDIENKAVFKSKLDNAASLYCTDKIKLLVEEHQFRGLTFDTDLLGLDLKV